MKQNRNLVLIGEKVILVPYLKTHVDTYNEWMKSQELLELTASEPLSLQQEYEMQESWLLDEKKCTFILIARNEKDSIESKLWQNNDFLVGDVNLYINDDDDPNRAEIEVMIADPKYRNKGIAYETLKMMMNYSCKNIGTKIFYCRILEKNSASIKLFEKLGFVVIERSEYFKEVTLELKVNDILERELDKDCAHVIQKQFTQE